MISLCRRCLCSQVPEYASILINEFLMRIIEERLCEVLSARQLLVEVLQVVADVGHVRGLKLLFNQFIHV